MVIFQENVSYDHYFATYTIAANPAGEPQFTAAPGTPTPNGLSGSLLTSNPNLANPFRLDRSNAITCDNNHDYTPEQQAVHGGLMDKFVQYLSPSGASCTPNLPMGYYDGNTVTALWEYAQNFAMNDNSFGTTFGPSTPGAFNLVSGQTHGATPASVPDSVASGTVIGDPDPTYDALLCTGLCGTTPAGAPSARCGYGPRLPLLVISPYSKQNYVDGTLTDQTSILKFVEYNWNLPASGPSPSTREPGACSTCSTSATGISRASSSGLGDRPPNTAAQSRRLTP